MSSSEKRNMASSMIQPFPTKAAAWNDWSTRKAVAEGYKVSGWVFKCISIITKNASSVPWRIEDKDGKVIDGHPLSKLLNNPNPQISRKDFFELIISWLQLSGEAPLKIVEDSKGPAELWPVSPDRIAPIESKDQSLLIEGYEIIDEKGNKKISSDFTVDNVFFLKYIDPSNPIKGIGPLQVAAKAVDIDNEQKDWNKSAMQNRGIIEGVFTFDKDLDATTALTYKQRIKEMFFGRGNTRDIAVIGSNAKYQRLSLTPAEMDFILSRKFNREEISGIFGVPLQLMGSEESATYNNFATAMRILWELTLIPILDDIKDTFNHVFAEQLQNGYVINYDLSDVKALKKDQKEKADTAKVYTEMGVPVSIVNEMMSLGIKQYEGWDKSNVARSSQQTEKRGSNDLMLKK